MKPSNAGKDTWPRAQIANQKLKQNVQTPDADGMQVFFFEFFSDTIREHISKILHGPPPVSAEVPVFDMQHFKRRIV